MHDTTAQNTLDLLILRTLERGPNHGFGITDHIQNVSLRILRIEEGSLYPALHRLERSRLIAGEWARTKAGRRARYYRLTPEGRARLSRNREQWNTLTQAVKRVLECAP